MVILLIVIALAITVWFALTWFRLKPYNQGALRIKTFDGSNSPYHPSVLYFKDGWNGYKYWMVETPFSPKGKPYEDRNECPSIHVSNDGINWKEIIENPIDDLTDKEVEDLDYFSDPHLVFVNGRIECWYRFTHRNGIKDNYYNLQLVRRISKDGVTWSEREVMVNLSTKEGNPLGNMVVSPAIIYQNGIYRMWYVNSESRRSRGFSYSESTDGKNWTEQSPCILNRSGYMPWHIDVNYIDGVYFLISYDFEDITMWSSSDGLEFSYKRLLAQTSVPGSFYSYKLYRACLIKDKNYKLYFSANDSLRTYIGLMEGNGVNSLKIKAIGSHQSFIGLLVYLLITKWRTTRFIVRRLIKAIFKK